ncbi:MULTISPECIES: ABC transporter ATP-binding protein [Acidianus]|uniref:Peptide ABC transporter ATPase n=1 Tax=Candidatus Acidianus copahuensis TaxID=1160895 RepID=A0A031LNT9_9CREN|nr:MULTISPECIES: ABC transporter ATP-binding protein [Acidianus]EZQ10042.1 peptide ABC transporter ATPase [Candidatus Acidianus copahuensis]NON63570.1 ABC transporter ATP-binding protein [Acidianus sp. RZ1]
MSLLEVEDLTISYKTTKGKFLAVKHLSFDIKKGEIISVIGESGSGKTTMAKALVRAIKPPANIDSGKVLLNGNNLLEISQNKFVHDFLWVKVSYVPQSSQNSLNPTQKIIEHFIDTGTSHGLRDKKEIEDRAVKLLQLVRLPKSILQSYPHQLSGGMKQRVLIALSLLFEPELIIMDEPVTALDIATQRHILNIIKELNEKNRTSIIFITHEINLAIYLATKLLVMYGGELMEFGDREKIEKNPLHPYTISLLSSVPKLFGDLSKIKPVTEGKINSKGCPFFYRCPNAMSICENNEPETYTIEGDKVRCFLYGANKA